MIFNLLKSFNTAFNIVRGSGKGTIFTESSTQLQIILIQNTFLNCLKNYSWCFEYSKFQ